MREPLLDYRGMSAECGRPVRTLRTLAKQGKIPYLKVGHRTVLFQASKVFRALEAYEVRAVTAARK